MNLEDNPIKDAVTKLQLAPKTPGKNLGKSWENPEDVLNPATTKDAVEALQPFGISVAPNIWCFLCGITAA